MILDNIGKKGNKICITGWGNIVLRERLRKRDFVGRKQKISFVPILFTSTMGVNRGACGLHVGKHRQMAHGVNFKRLKCAADGKWPNSWVSPRWFLMWLHELLCLQNTFWMLTPIQRYVLVQITNSRDFSVFDVCTKYNISRERD